MSGYDFVDPITGASIGQESGTDNCSPLVFDRCTANQTRSASGTCVDINDCSAACDEGSGSRSLTLGVCTCDQKPNVDAVCSQSCRNSAPVVSLVGGTTVNVTSKDPVTGKLITETMDLAD
jgi:hypothetical protein